MKYTKLFPYEINGVSYTQREVDSNKSLQLDLVKDCGRAIEDISTPSTEVQLSALKGNEYAIEYIKKPSNEVLDYMYKNHKVILERFYKID